MELVDRWRALKRNPHLCFAASPDQPCLNEHWIVTEGLAPLRKEFNALSAEEQEQVRREIMAETTVVVEKPKLTPAQMVELYLKLRNKKKALKSEFEERAGKLQAVMEAIEAELIKELDTRKEVNIKCEHGTAFTQIETSATVDDWSKTLDYIKTNEAWDLLERRVAKGAVLAAIEETKRPVPGVKINQLRVLRVRTA